MVDVTRGPEDQRRPRHDARAAATAAATSSSLRVGDGAAVEEEPSVADDPDHRRLAEPQRRRERLLERAGEALELGERQRATADARHRLLDRPAGERRQPLGAGPHRPGRLGEHPQHRHLLPRPGRVAMEGERPFERGERQLVRAQGPLQRVAAQALDEVGPAGDDPRLRAAEQLVA